ncbi:hypothetical protein HXX76_000731 [Chlamydomonas incerta]|uniref:Chlorophyllase n=1 Tax=Chlamydomonas incerta TaxID=51695 RepID=A0A835WF52_CHLIN|nr:hypothetical protein HXX76_000731 [Chlamydomonas incerta]|eukprot:KAG2446134.1 hypothetical protein HXX76_000731 [Chlamydomonas incerta]
MSAEGSGARPAGDDLPPESTPEAFSFSFSYRPVKEQREDEDEPRIRKVSVPVEVRGLPCRGTTGAVAPVLIFSSGFLTPAAAYGTLLQHLAAAGCVVVSYDKSFETLSYLMDDNDSVRLLEEVWRRAAELLADRQAVWGGPAVGLAFLVGHSRGAKVSVLAAAAAAAAPASGAEAYAAATAGRGGPAGSDADDVGAAGGEPASRRAWPSGQSAAVAAAPAPSASPAPTTTTQAAAAAAAAVAAASAAAASPGPSLLLPLAGLVLLDPADGAFEPQDPDRYPSALAALAATPPRAGVTAAAAGTAAAAVAGGGGGGAAAGGVGKEEAAAPLLPALVVGAGRGGDCVPRAKNFRVFYEAWPGPRALVTLPDAGHLQFLDASDRLTQSICATGRGVANAQVAGAAAAATAAFVRGVVAAAAAPGGAGADASRAAGAASGQGEVGRAGGSGGEGAGGLAAAALRGWCEGALEGATPLKFSVVAAAP